MQDSWETRGFVLRDSDREVVPAGAFSTTGKGISLRQNGSRSARKGSVSRPHLHRELTKSQPWFLPHRMHWLAL